MKKILITSIALILMNGCGMTQSSSGVNSGFLYTNWKDRTPATNAIVDNSIKSIKEGESCVKNIIGLFAYGDSSIEAAKLNGRVEKISYVDRNFFAFNPFYQAGCTIVKGE